MYKYNLFVDSIPSQFKLNRIFKLDQSFLLQHISAYYFYFHSSPSQQKTFHYDSTLWSNNETYNAAGGETGFDSQETKLPTYWNTSFSKMCLGMKIHEEDITNFILINKTADSLFSLIADGQYRSTSLGRDTWKTLIGPEASLQPNCNKEGFNAVCSCNKCSKVRIGILGNDQIGCDVCPDSRLGFGTGEHPVDSNTCGNAATSNGDNGAKNIKTMGYILVQ